MTNQTNAVNPSVLLSCASLCNFEVPTTVLDPGFLPSIWVSVGDFATFDEAKAACYAYADHPALIAMQANQCFKVGGVQ